jgi:hypothetical protein
MEEDGWMDGMDGEISVCGGKEEGRKEGRKIEMILARVTASEK